MKDNKSITNKSSEHLELGKYLESDMITLTDDEVYGGVTPLLSAVTAASAAISGYISNNTCPSTACTRAC